MPKEILIIKNISHEGPGLLQELLVQRNIPYLLVEAEGQPLPDPESFEAVVVLGGPDSANDQTQKIKSQIELLTKALSLNMPILGICLGLQLLVKAAGGAVVACSKPEIGWRDGEGKANPIFLNSKEKKDPFVIGLTEQLSIFHLHGETVELTPQMRLLASSKQCRAQIVHVGPKAYGIQGHFELTDPMFEEWLAKAPELTNENHSQLRQDYKHFDCYRDQGLRLFSNFWDICFH